MTVSWDGTTPRRAQGKVRRGKLSHPSPQEGDSLIPKPSLVERRQRRQEEEPPQQEPLSNPQPPSQYPQDTNGAPNPYTSFSNPNSPNTNTNVSPETLQNVLLTPPILPTTNTVGGNPDPSTPATTTTATTTTVVGDPVQVHAAPNASYGTGSSHVIPVVSVSSSSLSGGPANGGGEWEAFHSPPPPPTTTTTTTTGPGTTGTGTIPPGPGGEGGGPVPVQSASIPPPPLDGPGTTTGNDLPESGFSGGGPVSSFSPDSSSSLGVPAPTRAPSVPWGDNGGGGPSSSLVVGAPTPLYSQQPLTSQPPYVITTAGGPPHTDPTNHTKKIPPSTTKSSRCTNWSKSLQLPCHVGYSVWEHPVSWLVVLLSLYGLYAIRQQRHRRALTAVRGEYRQVAARDADRAFDDEDEPDDDEYYNDDNDHDNDDDAWMVNGSIQMKSLGQEGLSLEETNG